MRMTVSDLQVHKPALGSHNKTMEDCNIDILSSQEAGERQIGHYHMGTDQFASRYMTY